MPCESIAEVVETMGIKRYSELIRLKTFEERYEYLRLDGRVGQQTFGFDRYINQMLYTSGVWRSLRNRIIERDNACDLACEGRDIFDRVYVHHMNPITIDDIKKNTEFLLDPEYLICTSYNTHSAIHYGTKDSLILVPKDRRPNDTCPWRK